MKPDPKKPKAPITQRASDDGEPLVGSAPVPLWLFAVLGLLVFWAGVYLDENAGGFDPRVYGKYASFSQVESLQPRSAGDAFAIKGREVYGRSCVACHQPNGQGVPGQFPPLVESEWVIDASPDKLIAIILHGLTGPITVKGVEWNNAMVPWKDTLSDEEVAAVATYVRTDWGNKAAAVTTAQAKAIRDATKDRSDTFTAPELLKLQ